MSERSAEEREAARLERERRRSAKARASRVWSESRPESDSGRPTTTRSTSRSATSWRSARMPAFVAGRRIGSIGVASVPVGSLSAQPQRADP